jgi:RNA polymerase sigma-70 factor (ECF subfamily)
MAAASVTSDQTADATFAAFLQAAQPRVLQFLARVCPGDAEDVLQETLAKVWRLRASFDPSQNGEAWLLQAAFRSFCDHRARTRRQAVLVDDKAVAELEAPRIACGLELRDEVESRLQSLPPLERVLLVAFHGHGRSLKDLAARHGLPLNTIKSHLHRARARLAERRGGHDDAR